MNENDLYSNGRYVIIPTKKRSKVALIFNDRSYYALSRLLYNPFSLGGKSIKLVSLLFPQLFSSKRSTSGDFVIHLEKVLNIEILTSIYWATDGNKFVLQIIDKNKKAIFGYVKISNSTIGYRAISNESIILHSLPPRLVPKIIFEGEWRNHKYLIIENVTGSTETKLLSRTALNSILKELMLNKTCKLKEHPRYEYLCRFIIDNNIIKPGELTHFINEDITVTFSVEHGDFAPWNIICYDKSKYKLIDFEMGCQIGISGLDLIKYYFQYARLILSYKSEKIVHFVKENTELEDFSTYFNLFLLKEIILSFQKHENYSFEFNLLQKIKY